VKRRNNTCDGRGRRENTDKKDEDKEKKQLRYWKEKRERKHGELER
jgi:hypothetical protein